MPDAATFPQTGNKVLDAIVATFEQSNKIIGDNFQQILDRGNAFNAMLSGVGAALVEEIKSEEAATTKP